MPRYTLYCLWVLLGAWGTLHAQTLSPLIRVNQIGYYPNGPKIAVVASAEYEGSFFICTPDLKDTLYTGQLSAVRQSAFAERFTRVADFSIWQGTGHFVVAVPGLGYSYSFAVQPDVFKDVANAAIKGFYFQRVSEALPYQYAGIWSRPAGHPDNQVVVHASAATKERPEGTLIASPSGWYDAGDYNKYIVNSGITMGTLLSLAEDFPAQISAIQLNIPESNNGVPDLLDEVLVNLRWMLTMQDPADGGVYHKLTTAEFEGMVMPAEGKDKRYVVQKSTAAALNFTAVMAQASRVFATYATSFPGLADSCKIAAAKAWGWALKNPAELYEQEAMNKQYSPAINTGAYGDRNVADEWLWAAAEMYATTKDKAYLQRARPASQKEEVLSVPSWNQVTAMGYYTLYRFAHLLPAQEAERVRQAIVQLARLLIEGWDQRYYVTVMGKTARDFVWGSSAVAANQAIALIQAYKITGDQQFLKGAVSNVDYLLGRNATGFSFVTGYGHKTPMFPHHRPSFADGIIPPIPGLLSGGPNPGMQDKCETYTSTVVDEAFTDDTCSYASNEIAINWNAPLVYLLQAVEALESRMEGGK
jgi:endoglucanase